MSIPGRYFGRIPYLRRRLTRDEHEQRIEDGCVVAAVRFEAERNKRRAAVERARTPAERQAALAHLAALSSEPIFGEWIP